MSIVTSLCSYHYLAFDRFHNGSAFFFNAGTDLSHARLELRILINPLLKSHSLHFKLIGEAFAGVQHVQALLNKLTKYLELEHLLQEGLETDGTTRDEALFGKRNFFSLEKVNNYT